jgi:acyl-CoA reductase-like NAD-dependent aldehyde dehydrogenase
MKAREVILAELDEIAHLISAESGKPFGEAIAMEIAPVLDLMQYFARKAERLLKPRRVNIGLYTTLGRYSKIVYHRSASLASSRRGIIRSRFRLAKL